jgi:glutamate dehydrogenase/leucine dehydrogenase
LPSATQNEISGEEAKALIMAGVRYVAEGSNMGSTQEAIDIFEASRSSAKGDNSKGVCFYAPGKAANCGGVAVSGLEMAQNSQRYSWSSEEVDAKLKEIMQTCCKSPSLDSCRTHLTRQTRHAGTLERPTPTAPSPLWLSVPTSPVSKRLPTPCEPRETGGSGCFRR